MHTVLNWLKRSSTNPILASVYSGLILAALLAIFGFAWSYLRPLVASPQTKPGSSVLIVDANSGPASPRDYLDTYYMLTDEGRFGERDEYEKKWNGTKVAWRGYVNDIVRQGPRFLLILAAESSRGREYFAVVVPGSMEKTLLQLRKGDYISVAGTMKVLSGRILTVDSKSFERIQNPGERS